ncbi:unnamed protein product [Cyclocybe aegerita]|uniref:Alpha/beta hydrolase fold-3 domain-containing protein n=1 Tax=Cyclocybe aegerita TaxID=1973307 RepID=A0A8S0WE46_CYCAE|nr:unnamed protein product [Cyclocybe aegerita]
MPVTTTSAAVHIAPVVIKTFFKHGEKKFKRLKASRPEGEVPQDDIFFDEAFNIVKAFIALGTKNTIESLQAFTNTHIPAPPWAAVSPVTIPLRTCNDAADSLIEWFGPEELKHVVGGERWWQVRGLDGIDAEWMAQQDDLEPQPGTKPPKDKKLSEEEANILRMERLDKVLLYVHGGGYSWGSINTHRYQILHYAYKFKGRAFAVNYRKAPQYPWPCPLQDVIAAYLYLIRPPPEALHQAVPPSSIVFAGDSAGGGLCLTTLTVLRDLGLPMPAGSVLISPWVDLTHSFPSVMQNYGTDILPKHGFLAKPSTLWPVPARPGNGGRIVPTVTNPPPMPGEADTLKPSPERLERGDEGEMPSPGPPVQSQQEKLDNSSSEKQDKRETQSTSTITHLDEWEPKPPKVLMEDPNATPLELRSQIQMYAATELLTHPLVSPVLQGSLGDLPPLYILAGDGEVLRDEIIYLAHKAAHPAEYPTREGVLRDSVRQKENAEKFTRPTKVHLQVFDGMCHVLTVFMFTKSARYAYRSIADFITHITSHDDEHLERHPFPKRRQVPQETSADDKDLEMNEKEGNPKLHVDIRNLSEKVDDKRENLPPFKSWPYQQNEQISTQGNEGEVDEISAVSSEYRTTTKGEIDSRGMHMRRERVDLCGKVRPLEPREALQALKMKPSQVGLLTEAPALRWLEGQTKWDKRFAQRTEKVLKKQAKYETKAKRLIQHALDQGLIHDTVRVDTKGDEQAIYGVSTRRRKISLGKIQPERRWGPLDLADERPPPTAIAGRRNTPESLALLKKSIYHTAPVTHRTVPKLKVMDAVQAAFNPHDDPSKPPRQSVSEEQVRAQIIPVHGLKMWDGILRYFGRKSTAKAAKGFNAAAKKVGLKSNDKTEKGKA